MPRRHDEPPPSHSHTSSCYDVMLTCPTPAHQHSDRACYYQRGDHAGQLKCSSTEHTHSTVACYTKYTTCGYGP